MVLLLRIYPKAHCAEGMSRVTLAIAPRTFTAFNTWVADVSFGRSLPTTRLIRHMIGFPPSPSAIEWYSLPNGLGLQETHINPGQNLFSHVFMLSSMHKSHNGRYFEE